MKLIKSEEGKRLPVNFLAKLKFTSPKAEIVEFDLKPDEKIDLHIMKMPVMFYVLNGEAWALTEHAKTPATCGDMLYYEPNEQRGWMCTGEQHVKLLVIKMM